MKVDESTKIAIVTSGGSGLGLAIAEKFVNSHILTIIVGRCSLGVGRGRRSAASGQRTAGNEQRIVCI